MDNKQTMYSKQRVQWADQLKLFAIYAVLTIHTSAPLLLKIDPTERSIWWIGNVYDSAARWCIPIFFMISGAFLIEEFNSNNFYLFFKKRVQKIFIPFFFWSALFFAWRIYGIGENLLWTAFFKHLFTAPIYYHLWFIYVLIQLYLLTPLFSIFLKNASFKIQVYTFLLWLGFGSILPILQSHFNASTVFTLCISETVFNYAGFFGMGYVLSQIKNRQFQVPGFLLLIFFLINFIITMYGTYKLTFFQQSIMFNDLLFKYYSFNVIGMSVSIYLLFLKNELPQNYTGTIFHNNLHALAHYVPGIYYIHPLLISLSKSGKLGLTISQETKYPMFGVPLFSLGILIVSVVIVSIFKKVPLIKQLFG